MNDPKSVVGEADCALLNQYHQRRGCETQLVVLKKAFESAADDMYRRQLRNVENPISQGPSQIPADLELLKANW